MHDQQRTDDAPRAATTAARGPARTGRKQHPTELVFARRFKALRKARGLSLRDVWDLSGVNINTASNIETGAGGVSFRNAARLAEGFGYTLAEFLGEGPLTEIRERAAAELAALETGKEAGHGHDL